MLKLAVLLISSFLVGCTPTVKKVALYREKPEVVVVKKGSFYFSAGEERFIKRESRRLGIKVPDRKEIKKHIDFFLKSKASLETALRRVNLYAPYIKPILKRYDLPEELALLPLIESGFNPFAVSRSGAAGLWQLMPQTAKRYGLRVDAYVDERFDLYKSTEAAARYLRDLYRIFGSWELVLAAYNCGEGCVQRRTGGVNFWRSKWALPDQTRKYVPLFFAALLIARSPEKYGLSVGLENLKISKSYVKSGMNVKEFVKVANLKESTFRDLNPHIRGEYIPSGVHVYVPQTVKRAVPKRHRLKKEVRKKTPVKTSRRTFKKSPVRPPKIFTKKIKEEHKDDGRIVIRFSGEPSQNVRVLRLKNGAVVYIKE